MSNPSTVWAQLSLPLSPVGSIPFVGLDGVSIVTSVVNLFYDQVTMTLSVTNGIRFSYTSTVAVPGNTIINKPAGRVKLAAGQTVLVISNTLVTATDIIELNIESLDATLTRATAIPGAGIITITGNLACTAAVIFSFVVNKTF